MASAPLDAIKFLMDAHGLVFVLKYWRTNCVIRIESPRYDPVHIMHERRAFLFLNRQ